MIWPQVHTRWYECTGHPVDFYQIILILVLILLGLYFLLNVYNLLWILFPSLTRLGRIMAVYKSNCGELGQLDDFYYKSRNPRLLLDLLCSSSGPALPLRSLALLEPSFNQSLLPSLQPSQEEGLVQARVPQSSLLDHLLKSSSTSIAVLAQVNLVHKNVAAKGRLPTPKWMIFFTSLKQPYDPPPIILVIFLWNYFCNTPPLGKE